MDKSEYRQQKLAACLRRQASYAYALRAPTKVGAPIHPPTGVGGFKRHSKLIFIFTLLFLTFFLFFRISYQPGSDNDLSRLGGIVAIARYNEFNIDKTVQVVTDDKVWHEGKYYSSKPPLLNIVLGKVIRSAFLVYKPALLDNDVAIYRISTLLAVVLPLLGIYILFYLLLGSALNISPVKKVIFSMFLIFGTLLFSYSRYLTNHILETFAQLGVFFLLLKGFRRNKNLKLILLGFLLSVLFALDVTYGIIVAPVTVFYLLMKERGKFFKCVLLLCAGFIPVVTLHFLLNYMQFGIFLPPQLFPEKYLSYEGSKWIGRLTGMLAINEGLTARIFNYTFGTYGFFLYQPLLILPFFIKRNWKDVLFRYTTVILLIYILFNVLMQPDYGGSSYGLRRFLPLIPLFYFYVVRSISGFSEGKKRKVLIILLFFFNFLFSLLGYVNTWENWNFFANYDDNRSLYFPLLFTARKILSLYEFDWVFAWMY